MMENPHFLIRCDGSINVGLGHVVRCLALADELRENHHGRVWFAMREGPAGTELVRRKGYEMFLASEGSRFEYGTWLGNIMEGIHADVLVLDVRDDLPRSVVDELRSQGVLIVTIDDPSERRLAADLAFYPPVPQIKRIDWSGFSGELHVGWEWVILRRDFASSRPKTKSEIPVILIIMGGSDPAGLTLKALNALDQLGNEFRSIVAVGPAFSYIEALDAFLARARHAYEIQQSVTDMAELMAGADLAIASFGSVAYELAAVGVPGIYLSLSEDHAESASCFVHEQIGLSLGIHDCLSEGDLLEEIRKLLLDSELRESMSKRARRLGLGNGAQNVAQEILCRCTEPIRTFR